MPTSTVTYSLPNAVSTGGSYKSTIVHNKIPISSDSQLIFQPQNGYTTYNRYDRDDRDGGASTVSSVTLPFSVGGSKVLYPNSQKNPGYASSKASTTSELDGYPTSPSPSIADSNLSFTSRGSGNRSFRRSHATIYGINETKTRSKIDLTVASEIGLPGEEIRKLPLELEEQVGITWLVDFTKNRARKYALVKSLRDGKSVFRVGLMPSRRTGKEFLPRKAKLLLLNVLARFFF